MRILVCGGRTFGESRGAKFEQYPKKKAERNFVMRSLYDFCYKSNLMSEPDNYGNTMPKDIVIIHGAATGVDSIANDWAIANCIGLEVYPADWKKYGKSAGFIRNKQMLDEGKPDLVIAFPGGLGTKMMVNLAKKASIPVETVEYK